MSDVVGHDPARWPRPRRSLVIATVVVVLVGATWLTVAERKPHHAGRPFSAPGSAAASSTDVSTVKSSAPAPASGPSVPMGASTFVATLSPPAVPPPALVGPAPTNTGVRLLVVSTAVTAGVEILALDGGTTSHVQGFPAGGCPVTSAIRIPHTEQWAVVWQPAANTSPPCALAAGGLYIIDDTSRAHLIGSAERVVAADRGSLWTVAHAHLLPGQQLSVPEQVQRVSLTGAALSGNYSVPIGWTVEKGLTHDLLLLARDTQAGSDNWEVWQPSTGTVLGQYEQVLDANTNVVVWVNNTCVPNDCPVHLSTPAGGADRIISLPAGAYAYDGSLSDDGTYLALSLGTGVDTQGSTDQDNGVLVDLSNRAVHPIQQTKIPAGETASLSLNWAARGWLIINTPGPSSASQLAAYNPTTGSFVVSRHALRANQFVAF
ncbi:MAG TPA: hypothetical protein VIJ96_16590 [Acidothermaceae bacterium]